MKKLFIFSIILPWMFFFSCGDSQKSAQRGKQTLHISFNMDPLTLDPRKSGDLVTSTLLFMLNKGLVELQEDGSLEPSLAESYEISQDGKVYTFHIRECSWSDGKPITAYDFEKSWKKVIDPSFPSLCPQLLYAVKNAEKAAKGEISLDKVKINAKDAKTLIVKLDNPTPYFLSLTSFCIFFPVPTHIDEKNPNWEAEIGTGNKLVTSGPFKIKKWDRSNLLILEKNKRFWNKNNINLDNIYINIISNENTALQMFENKQLDWLGSPICPLPLDSLPTLLKKGRLRLTPIGGTIFCSFNTTKFPLTNKNLRIALSCAINRKSIVDNITQLREPIATRCLPPVLMKNKNKYLVEDNNIDLAQKHFQQALEELQISPQELNLTLTYSNCNLSKKQAEALQEQWLKGLGIKVKLEQVEPKVVLERLHKHDFQMGLAQWISQYNDPMNILERFKWKDHSKNYPSWQNEEYISLIDQSFLAKTPEKRLEIIETAEKILMEEMPLTPIHHKYYSTIQQPNIHNIIIGPVGDLNFDKVYKSK